MIGLSFQIPNAYGQYLIQILKNIPVHDFTWKIDEDDIYLSAPPPNDSVFQEPVISGESFKQRITLPEYYVFFAKLQAFPSIEDIHELISFNDYFNSSCKMVVLVTDAEFVEVYAKEESWLEQVQRNVEQYGFTHLEVITEIKDGDRELTSR